MGHVLGAKNSFAVRRRTRPQGGHAGLILSNRGPEASLGAPRVAIRRAQAPTPHARRLPSVHTYKQSLIGVRAVASFWPALTFYYRSRLSFEFSWYVVVRAVYQNTKKQYHSVSGSLGGAREQIPNKADSQLSLEASRFARVIQPLPVATRAKATSLAENNSRPGGGASALRH